MSASPVRVSQSSHAGFGPISDIRSDPAQYPESAHHRLGKGERGRNRRWKATARMVTGELGSAVDKNGRRREPCRQQVSPNLRQLAPTRPVGGPVDGLEQRFEKNELFGDDDDHAVGQRYGYYLAASFRKSRTAGPAFSGRCVGAIIGVGGFPL